MSESALHFIPRIWANAVHRSLTETSALMAEWDKQLRERHAENMKDPAYAKAYELRMAELEAESYWTALYDNACPVEEDTDEW